MSKLILSVIALCLWSVTTAHAQSPREQLNQMVQQLQKNPSDDALREKIIKLVRTINPAPAIPEDAKKAFVKGNELQRQAKSPIDYERAISMYQEALRLAPWWIDVYYNLSVAQEFAGKYAEAISSLRLYLLAAPTEKDAHDTNNRISKIQVKMQMERRSSFEGYWRREGFINIVTKEWVKKEFNSGSTDTEIHYIRKNASGSYDVGDAQGDWSYQQIRADATSIEWFNPGEKEECASPGCGVRMTCRRTGDREMECLFKAIGLKTAEGLLDVTQVQRLYRYERCQYLGYENDGVKAMRCE